MITIALKDQDDELNDAINKSHISRDHSVHCKNSTSANDNIGSAFICQHGGNSMYNVVSNSHMSVGHCAHFCSMCMYKVHASRAAAAAAGCYCICLIQPSCWF